LAADLLVAEVLVADLLAVAVLELVGNIKLITHIEMKKRYLFLMIFLVTFLSYSQKVKVQEGNIKNLKGVKEYNLVFDYSNVEIPNFESEEAFLKDKMDRRELKGIGKGERFKKAWFGDREKYFEPYFIEFFNDYFVMKRKIKVTKNSTKSKYTMLVKTNFLYAGYHVGAFNERSKLKASIFIFETDNPNNILFSTKPIYIHNGRAHYTSNIRMASTYGILAQTFAKYLRKKT
jgi:hypothetical protein